MVGMWAEQIVQRGIQGTYCSDNGKPSLPSGTGCGQACQPVKNVFHSIVEIDPCQSYFWVFVTTRAAAFRTRCSWSAFAIQSIFVKLASRQLDPHQFPPKSLLCSWISSLEQYADGPQTTGLVIKLASVKTFVFYFSSGFKAQCESSPHFNCTLEVLLITYLLTYFTIAMTVFFMKKFSLQVKLSTISHIAQRLSLI